MTEQKRRYLLVIAEQEHYNYGDDYDIVSRLAPLPDSLNPLIWELTNQEYVNWSSMFRSNYAYSSYRFVQVASPDDVTIATLTAALEKHLEAQQIAEAKRRKAEEERQRKAAEKKSAREAAKLLKNQENARQVYEELKKQFEGEQK